LPGETRYSFTTILHVPFQYEDVLALCCPEPGDAFDLAKVWGTNIPIALVGAPDAGRLREDRPGLSLKVAPDPAAIAMSSARSSN
jgi:hypothetical protein